MQILFLFLQKCFRLKCISSLIFASDFVNSIFLNFGGGWCSGSVLDFGLHYLEQFFLFFFSLFSLYNNQEIQWMNNYFIKNKYIILKIFVNLNKIAIIADEKYSCRNCKSKMCYVKNGWKHFKYLTIIINYIFLIDWLDFGSRGLWCRHETELNFSASRFSRLILSVGSKIA